jgi:hypothetical protein
MASGIVQTYANALLDHGLRHVANTSPTTVYIALMSTTPTATAAGTELTGNGYARTAVTMAASASGSIANSAAVQFPTPSADWTAATSFNIFDDPTAGNRMYFGALGTSVTAKNGVPVVLPIGAATVALA